MYDDESLVEAIRAKKKTATDPVEVPDSALEDLDLGSIEEAAGGTSGAAPQEPTEADKLKKRIRDILG